MKLLLRPFMLRRLKENVQRGLVPKHEVVEKVQLEATKQREIYLVRYESHLVLVYRLDLTLLFYCRSC
jgi:SNF2 family DNA or RNA helicase